MNQGIAIILLTAVLAIYGCSQTTQVAATYQKAVTTMVEITTDVPASLWISDRELGATPITFPFTYDQDVENVAGNANYWQTNPGTAAALSVLSFGFYVPFSFIPAEQTAEAKATQKFRGNQLTLRLVADGHEPITHSVQLRGEPKISLRFSLKTPELNDQSK
jgi:hypothetical protein